MVGELVIWTRQSNLSCSYLFYQREITFDKTEFCTRWPLVSRKLPQKPASSVPEPYSILAALLTSLYCKVLPPPSRSAHLTQTKSFHYIVSFSQTCLLTELISLAAVTFVTQDTLHLLSLAVTEGLSVPPVPSRPPQLTYYWQCLTEQNYPMLSSEQ